MSLVIAMLVLTTATINTPNPRRDINAFIRFMWATERCQGITINVDKTMKQVNDLGGAQQWDMRRIRDKILVESRIAESEYNQDPILFCDTLRELFLSYEPAFLRKMGVID